MSISVCPIPRGPTAPAIRRSSQQRPPTPHPPVHRRKILRRSRGRDGGLALPLAFSAIRRAEILETMLHARPGKIVVCESIGFFIIAVLIMPKCVYVEATTDKVGKDVSRFRSRDLRG